MSSQKQIDSARANGAKSHGPKTEAGRRKSSLNALKHGLYSATVVLSTEPRKQYDEMLDAYLHQFHPEGPVEIDLVEEMVAAKWRQRRLWTIEAELLEDEMCEVQERLDERGEEYNKITLLARAYRRQAESAMSLLARHEARLERAYSRALKNLLELQRLRKPESPSDQQKMQERTESAPSLTSLATPKPPTRNEQPETRNQKPETRNEKPPTRTKERRNRNAAMKKLAIVRLRTTGPIPERASARNRRKRLSYRHKLWHASCASTKKGLTYEAFRINL